MKSMPISEFKSKCIAVLKDAQRSGKGLIVTRRGQPLARVEPIPPHPGKRMLGTFRGRMKFHMEGTISLSSPLESWVTDTLSVMN